MNLVVDIGNTNVVLAIAQGNSVQKHWRLPTQKETTEKEVLIQLESLFHSTENSEILEQIQYIGLATVVPSMNPIWSRALKAFFSLTPFVLDVSKCDTFEIHYEIPTQIGADRLCNVLACQALSIPEAIVIDLGTATTFDIYSNNTYWGGVICPGVLSSLKELSRKASLLSEVQLFWNNTVVGKNTDDALRNGILYGSVGQIEAILAQIQIDIPMTSPSIIATGGLSKLIGEKTSKIQRFEEHFTLVGLNHFVSLQTQSKF